MQAVLNKMVDRERSLEVFRVTSEGKELWPRSCCALQVPGGKQRLNVPIFMFFSLTTDKESFLDQTLARWGLLNLLPN